MKMHASMLLLGLLLVALPGVVVNGQETGTTTGAPPIAAVEIAIPEAALTESSGEIPTIKIASSAHFANYMERHPDYMQRALYVGEIARQEVESGCRHVVAGDATFQLEVVEITKETQEPIAPDQGDDIVPADVEHHYGCTKTTSTGQVLLHPNIEQGLTGVIFGRIKLRDTEHLVDCPEGSALCHAMVLAAPEIKDTFPDAQIQVTHPAGRKLKIPLILLIIALLQLGAAVAGAGITASKAECFPASASVMLAGGMYTTIGSLNPGDRVAALARDGSLIFDEVYLWGHKDSRAVSPFVSIKTAANSTIRATKDHFLHVVPANKVVRGVALWKDAVHIPSGRVKAGDYLFVFDQWGKTTSDSGAPDATARPVKVTDVTQQMLQGLYNPYTLSGNIIVDGFAASSHSDMIGVREWVGSGPHAPHVYQALLAPVRLVYRLNPSLLGYVDGRFSIDGWERANIKGIVKAIASFCSAGGGGALSVM